MWDNKQNMLLQNLYLQTFLRDCRQAEILLSEQENFLSKEDMPVRFALNKSSPTFGLFVSLSLINMCASFIRIKNRRVCNENKFMFEI